MIDRAVYTERYAEQYREGAFEVALVRIRRKHVLRTLHRYPHRRILEVGCGLEPLFPYVDAYDAYTIVEPSEAFVQNAVAQAGSDPAVRIVQGTLEEAYDRLTADAYDMIVLSSLLHEVPDPDALLTRVRALCGPATVVHVNVPNVRSFHRLLGVAMGLINDVHQPTQNEIDFQRHTRFDKESLVRKMQAHGFEVLSFATYFVKPFSNKQMEQMLSHQIIAPDVIEGLEKMSEHLPDMGCEMYVELQKA